MKKKKTIKKEDIRTKKQDKRKIIKINLNNKKI